jgi:hypothetical protein
LDMQVLRQLTCCKQIQASNGTETWPSVSIPAVDK